MKILRMNPDHLRTEWENCVRRLVSFQLAVDDELKNVKDTAVSLYMQRRYLRTYATE
jgi:hypothetical protein